MPYLCSEEKPKQLEGRTIEKIVALNASSATIYFTDGSKLELIAHKPTNKHIEGLLWEHRPAEIIANFHR